MAFNLLSDPWLPVRLRSGRRKWLAVPDLADGCPSATPTGDYPIRFDWPRSDFNMASLELCVGLVSLALDIRNEDDWRDRWRSPPDSTELREELAPFVHAFWLDGDGPRAFQDLEQLDGNSSPIEALLMDSPGNEGQRKNSDLLTHRGRYERLGLPAAAIALYTLQAYAPAGGAGNRTSMRGGGPLTVIAVPVPPDEEKPMPLWRRIALNLGYSSPVQKAGLEKALPWLAPTLVSNRDSGGRTVSATDAHELQAFFGMPRRIRLVFSIESDICPMTGWRGPVTNGFVQRPWGANYGQWRHPLTPYRRQQEAGELLSVKPKSGRFGYRDWVAVTVGTREGKLSIPSSTLRLVRSHRRHIVTEDGQSANPRIHLAGWAMNKMEAVAYLSAEQPLHLARSGDQQATLDEIARVLAAAGDAAGELLRNALKWALFGPKSKAKSNSGALDQGLSAFFEETEDQFHDLLDQVLTEVPEDGVLADPIRPRVAWLYTIRVKAGSIFDRLAPVPIDDAEAARQIVDAYAWLSGALAGFNASGNKLYDALGIARPRKSKQGARKKVA